MGKIEHDIRVGGHPSVWVCCMTCRDVDDDPTVLHKFPRGHMPSMLEINTVALNHYRDKVPPSDVKLEPHPMPEPPRNPCLPEAPEDGKHIFGQDGRSYRCSRCGVYNRPDVESTKVVLDAPCEGGWRQSGKMRAAAEDRWEEEKKIKITAMHVTTGVPSSGDDDEGLDLG